MPQSEAFENSTVTAQLGSFIVNPPNPYDRPELSNGLWKGKQLESIWRKTAKIAWVELHLGTTAAQIEVKGRSVVDRNQTAYAYDKLLLATGGSPRHLPFGGEAIIYFRALDDYRRLRALAEKGD